jgi:hypothetical protein
VRFVTVILLSVLLTLPALSVELFCYRGAGRDGGTLEFTLEFDEAEVPKTATKEKVAEIATDFTTTFYRVIGYQPRRFHTMP